MPEEKAIISFGDLAKPATILIEKISNAIGVLYEPTRITRNASAEAEAEKIRALARFELSELEERAIRRKISQEARRQKNIEHITAQAIPNLESSDMTQALDEDWLAHLFRQCEDVSDDAMQSIWSKVLSGEANRTGAFSKRTVDFLATLDKSDAVLFTKLSQFCWIYELAPVPVIFDFDAPIYKKAELTFSDLQHLADIGLVAFSGESEYQIMCNDDVLNLRYFGRTMDISFSENQDRGIHIGKALLTKVGIELFEICGAKANEEFYFYAAEAWFKQGKLLSTPLGENGDI